MMCNIFYEYYCVSASMVISREDLLFNSSENYAIHSAGAVSHSGDESGNENRRKSAVSKGVPVWTCPKKSDQMYQIQHPIRTLHYSEALYNHNSNIRGMI
jgi:hypothetical protein